MKNKSVKSRKRFNVANLKNMDDMLEPKRAELLHTDIIMHDRLSKIVVGH